MKQFREWVELKELDDRFGGPMGKTVLFDFNGIAVTAEFDRPGGPPHIIAAEKGGRDVLPEIGKNMQMMQAINQQALLARQNQQKQMPPTQATPNDTSDLDKLWHQQQRQQ